MDMPTQINPVNIPKTPLNATSREKIRSYLFMQLDLHVGQPVRNRINQEIDDFTQLWLKPLIESFGQERVSLLRELIGLGQGVSVPVMTPEGVELTRIEAVGEAPPEFLAPYPSRADLPLHQWEQLFPNSLKLLTVTPKQKLLANQLALILEMIQVYENWQDSLDVMVRSATAAARNVHALIENVRETPLAGELPVNWQEEVSLLAMSTPAREPMNPEVLARLEAVLQLSGRLERGSGNPL